MNKRYRISRRFMIFWTLFIGLGAVAGATGMLSDPSGKALGMDGMLPFFQMLPFSDVLFQDFLFSGIALLIVNGITNLVAAVLLIMKKKAGIVLGGVFGFTLMLWIIIQFIIFPLNYMSTIYFIFGLFQLICGIVCYVGFMQSGFSFDESRYTNVGKDKSKLVIYYSREGYTKKLAHEMANVSGAEIFEIKTTEKTDGDVGFWWCGRFGLNKLSMPLEKYELELLKYEKITILSPVWVFGIAAPVKTFLEKEGEKLDGFDLISVHFMKARFSHLKNEAESYAKTKCSSYKSYSSHFGVIKEIK